MTDTVPVFQRTYTSEFSKTDRPSLAAVKLHSKDKRWPVFFEIDNSTESAYKDKT